MNSNPKNESVLCGATTLDGKPCSSKAQEGSRFCFSHDPAKSEERRAAQSKGGKANRLKTLGPDVPDLKVQDSQDIKKLLSQTIDQVRKGQIDPRVGYAIAYLSSLMLKASEKSELEARLAELEAAVKSRKKTSSADFKLTGEGS